MREIARSHILYLFLYMKIVNFHYLNTLYIVTTIVCMSSHTTQTLIKQHQQNNMLNKLANTYIHIKYCIQCNNWISSKLQLWFDLDCANFEFTQLWSFHTKFGLITLRKELYLYVSYKVYFSMKWKWKVAVCTFLNRHNVTL